MTLDYVVPEARLKAELKMAVSRARCFIGSGVTGDSSDKRCRERAVVGSLLCERHRNERLALVRGKCGTTGT